MMALASTPGWTPSHDIEEELTNLQVDVLSARCIVHRLRRKGAELHVARIADPEAIAKALQDAQEILEFLSDVRNKQQP